MDFMVLVLKVILVLVAIGLTVLVVLQDNRGGGLAGVLAGYGGESAFGTETVSKVKKLTSWLGALFLVLLLAIARLGPQTSHVITPAMEQKPAENPAAPAPEGPTSAPEAPVTSPAAGAPEAPAPPSPAAPQ
jgi:preprotein translocase subunit SecG